MLLRHQAQSLSFDSVSSRKNEENVQTSGVDTAFSQRSSNSFFNTTVYLFSQVTSRNPTVLSSDNHLQNFDLSTIQYFNPPTSNCADYPFIVNDTLVSHPRHDPRFLHLATHKMNSNL